MRWPVSPEVTPATFAEAEKAMQVEVTTDVLGLKTHVSDAMWLTELLAV